MNHAELSRLVRDAEQRRLAAEHPLLLVDFWADWCGPCKRLVPVLDALAAEIPELTVVKVNIDERADLALEFQVMSVPTLLLYVNGEPAARRTGSASLQDLRSWIEPHFPFGKTGEAGRG